MKKRRQNPPYSQHAAKTLALLSALERRPRGGIIAVFVGGDSFTRCRSWLRSAYAVGLVLPSGTDPLTIDWRIANGWAVLVFGSVTLSSQQRLVLGLMRDGATLVSVADDTGSIACYNPEVRHAA